MQGATDQIALRCPVCGAGLLSDDAQARCMCGAAYNFSPEGVLALVRPEFLGYLAPFTAAVTAFRAARGIGQLDPTLLPRLPDAVEKRRDPDWRQRRADLRVVRQVLRPMAARQHTILEIGAWNHWLTAHLAAAGHRVTGVDTFADRVDGLGARCWFERPTWRSVQLDVRDLSPLGAGWDLIVINRCAQFAADPAAWLRQLPRLLAPGGRVLLLGLAFFRRPQQKRHATSRLVSDFRAATGRDLFLHPTRGWLGEADLRAMQQLGITLWPYPDARLLAANARACIKPERALHRWGWWRAGGADRQGRVV